MQTYPVHFLLGSRSRRALHPSFDLAIHLRARKGERVPDSCFPLPRCTFHGLVALGQDSKLQLWFVLSFWTDDNSTDPSVHEPSDLPCEWVSTCRATVIRRDSTLNLLTLNVNKEGLLALKANAHSRSLLPQLEARLIRRTCPGAIVVQPPFTRLWILL